MVERAPEETARFCDSAFSWATRPLVYIQVYLGEHSHPQATSTGLTRTADQLTKHAVTPLCPALARANGLGLGLEKGIGSGAIQVRQVDPAELSPGEFVIHIGRGVDAGCKLVVIDSLNGYLNATFRGIQDRALTCAATGE